MPPIRSPALMLQIPFHSEMKKVARRIRRLAPCQAFTGEDNSAPPLLSFQSLPRESFPTHPHQPVWAHHSSRNRNGRAIRAAPFADRRPASTSMVLADRVSERYPAGPEAGGADRIDAVKRPKGRYHGPDDEARRMQKLLPLPHSTRIRRADALRRRLNRCGGICACKALWTC